MKLKHSAADIKVEKSFNDIATRSKLLANTYFREEFVWVRFILFACNEWSKFKSLTFHAWKKNRSVFFIPLYYYFCLRSPSFQRKNVYAVCFFLFLFMQFFFATSINKQINSSISYQIMYEQFRSNKILCVCILQHCCKRMAFD